MKKKWEKTIGVDHKLIYCKYFVYAENKVLLKINYYANRKSLTSK